MANNKKIIITGDIVFENHLYKDMEDVLDKKNLVKVTSKEELGGAYRLKKILEDCYNGNDYSVHIAYENENNEDKLIEKLKKINGEFHYYAEWVPCKEKKFSDKSDAKVWRMKEPVGEKDCSSVTGVPEYNNYITPDDTQLTNLKYEDKDILLINDEAIWTKACGNCEPTSSKCTKEWPELDLSQGKPEFIILKTGKLTTQCELWKDLGNNKERLIIITSIDYIRKADVLITKGLSWERMVWELKDELQNNSHKKLLECKHLIVRFGIEGVLWVENALDDKDCEYHLIYDPDHIEDEWSSQFDGFTLGYHTSLTATIVNSLACNKEDKENDAIKSGIMNGLYAMRSLHSHGFGSIDTGEKEDENKKDWEYLKGFPFKHLKEEIEKVRKYATAVLDKKSGKNWSILNQNREDKNNYGLARRVAKFGRLALSDVPYVKFGKLFTVDRNEIESLRGIKRLIKHYNDKKDVERPLSIAVFGPPGSGKSFGIKELAKSSDLGSEVKMLEFNLSQFASEEDLIGALHQVRDEVLNGKLPFVFWDEFDTSELKWLKNFLAPMQDGLFLEDQIYHPIGKCVFIFAGGTSEKFVDFNIEKEKEKTPDNVKEVNAENGEKSVYDDFKTNKGPDFVSRLRGFMNVIGPNKNEDLADTCFPIRRALMLRSNADLKIDEHGVLEIDHGLLNAMLEVPKYNHGSRSLATILKLIKGAGGDTLKRSFIPPEEQLSIHVDYNAFIEQSNRKLFCDEAIDLFNKSANNSDAEMIQDIFYLAGYKIVNKEDTQYKVQNDEEIQKIKGDIEAIFDKLNNSITEEVEKDKSAKPTIDLIKRYKSMVSNKIDGFIDSVNNKGLSIIP